LVGALLVLNIAFYYSLLEPSGHQDEEEIDAMYVAYMPELEQKQRQNPRNLLWGGVHGGGDPEAPERSGYLAGEEWPSYSVLGAIAYRCGFTGLSIRTYVYGMDEIDVYDMPDRLFLQDAKAASVQCVRGELPNGYVLARLSIPVSPSTVGWDAGELPIAREYRAK
jgi:hypothetical protein